MNLFREKLENVYCCSFVRFNVRLEKRWLNFSSFGRKMILPINSVESARSDERYQWVACRRDAWIRQELPEIDSQRGQQVPSLIDDNYQSSELICVK